MKPLIGLLLCIISIKSYCQFEKSVCLITSANFSFKTKGLATNVMGVGIGLDAVLLAKHRLQILLETSADQFAGDKVFIIEDQGRQNKSASIYAIKAGPQFFITKNIALSSTIGPSWHSIRSIGFTQDYGFKFALTGFWGDKRRLVTRVFMVNILTDDVNIKYVGVQLGYGFSRKCSS